MKKLRLAAIALTITATIGLAAPAANALTDLRGKYAGLVVYGSGSPLGQLYTASDYAKYNIYGRYANDTTGDRLQAVGQVRDLFPTNGQQAYAQGLRWSDGLFCYVSGIGAESVSVSCTSGTWNQSGSDNKYTTTGSGSWAGYTFRYPLTGSMGSQRYELHVCEDEPWFMPDECSGSRVIGIDWN